jgi:hypothetical protein
LAIGEKHMNLEFRRILRNYEESIQCNKTSIFYVTFKIYENEHQCTSQVAIIMNTFVKQKQKIDELEVSAVC